MEQGFWHGLPAHMYAHMRAHVCLLARHHICGTGLHVSGCIGAIGPPCAACTRSRDMHMEQEHRQGDTSRADMSLRELAESAGLVPHLPRHWF